MAQETQWVAMGYIKGAFGIKGWVKVAADTEYADSLLDYPEWRLNRNGKTVSVVLEAGKTAAMGWQPYIEFLALVSISLGVMNLLPVPVLDGGHLVFYSFEWLRGKPLSEGIQSAGLRIGLALMLMLMVLAFFNDITRLFG